MNKIRVRIKDPIKELQMLQKVGYECAHLIMEEAEEGIPARIMLSDYGCVFDCKDWQGGVREWIIVTSQVLLLIPITAE